MSDQVFKIGTNVEVKKNNDGFGWAWYVAKIIEGPKCEECAVEYKDLVTGEHKKLSERVHVSNVRPLAPPATGDEVIEVNDVVDAFLRNGWWSGVVGEFVGGGGREFLVCFDDPSDNMRCYRSDLRLHFDWVDGKWEKPPKKNHNSVTGRMFSEGTAVEVSLQEENYDVWHLGTVMELTGNNKLLVKYRCRGDSDKHKTQEFPYCPGIRPAPPTLEDNDFVLLEKVEAYYECCWWNGVILKILEDRKYIVLVKHAKKGMTLDHSNLRPRMVWTGGEWIDEAKSGNSNRQKRRAKKQQARNGCASTEIVEKVCITEGVDISVKEVKGALSAKVCEMPRKKDQKKQSRDEEIHTVDSINGSTQGDNSSKRKRGRPKMLLKKQTGEGSTGAKSSLWKMVMKDSCVVDEAKLSTENDCLMLTTIDDEPNTDPFRPSGKDNMKVNMSDKKLSSGVHRHNVLLSETTNIPLLEDQAGETVPSKKVNRPKNCLSDGSGEMSKTVDSESQVSQYQECHDALKGKTTLPEIYHVKDDMLIDEPLVDIDDDQPLSIFLNKLSPLGDIDDDQPVSMLLNTLSPTDSYDSRALPVQHQCANANGRQDDFGTPPVAKEDRTELSPLQKTDGPNPGDLPVKCLNQQAVSKGKGGELETPSATISIDNVENYQSLPFVKGSPLWKNIESMEIFKKMAQTPHFSPLVKCREETREGLAIGHMVNFFNLVEKTSKLQFSSPITIIESSLETLDELESHGFVVDSVRACLTQLLSKKQRGEELQKEYDDIGNEISNSVDEKAKFDQEITQLYQKIREFVRKLGETLWRKEMKERAISTLQSKQDLVGENVHTLQLEFETIAGSLC